MKIQIIDIPGTRMYYAEINGKKILHETTDNHLTENEFKQLAMEKYLSI